MIKIMQKSNSEQKKQNSTYTCKNMQHKIPYVASWLSETNL
jgi:hypothetical protein